MSKLDYITRQLARARKKRFEHYVITRIWHLLNELSIKFTTQQYVIRPNGRALTDMYFPQFGIHIEIDEAYHLNQQEQDRLREADIIEATNHEIFRVNTVNSIDGINNQINNIVERIINVKNSLPNFVPWDIEAEQNPQTYIDRGYICILDDVAFKYSYLAANCFGHNINILRRGGIFHPNEENTIIWFPKLYPNNNWNNSISDDETTIIEINADPNTRNQHIDNIINGKEHTRIVFARVKSPLGDVMYRFKGKYQLDINVSNYQNGLVWIRNATQVYTYGNYN